MVALPRLIMAFLRLCRPPNLFTLPGDVFAGYITAGTVVNLPLYPAVGIVGISVLLYLGGLLLNDWFDQHIDAKERPNRPIPSGQVKPNSVLILGIVGFIFSFGISLFYPQSTRITTFALIGLIVLYNSYSKHRRWLGILNIASCRVGNFLLGASICNFQNSQWPSIFLGACLIFYYVVIFSDMARMETTQSPRLGLIILINLTPIAALLWFFFLRGEFTESNGILFLIVWSLFFLNTLVISYRIRSNKIQNLASKYIGQLIRNLIPLQSLIMVINGASPLMVTIILLHWPIAAILGQRFYGS